METVLQGAAGRKTARQRFLRRTRALTLTISIPSMLVANDQSSKMHGKEKVDGGRVTSSSLLKRSQSSREVWRGRRSSSEQCISLASRKEEEQDVCIQPGSLANMSNMDNLGTEAEGVGSFGFRLKRSLTVSHIIENFNKSFRVKRSQSQREVTPRKGKSRYGSDFWNHMVARKPSYVALWVLERIPPCTLYTDVISAFVSALVEKCGNHC